MQIIKGKTIRAGLAVGKLYIVDKQSQVKKNSINNAAVEKDRAAKAIRGLSLAMAEQAAKADKKAAEIVAAQKLLLEDASFSDAILAYIENNRVNAEYAAQACGDKLAQEMEQLQDEYLRARAEDMRQVAAMLIDELMGCQRELDLTEDVILAAEEFTPAQLAALNKEHVLGLLAHKGSPTSHTSILAANYGLPYIIGLDIKSFVNNTEVVLDADQDCVIVAPDEETRELALAKVKEQQELAAQAPAVTKMKVYANISSVQDLERVVELQADGVGLFRTEFIYMNRDTAPDEEEQYEIYSQVLKAMEGKEVIIRTIDVGTDKPVSYFNMQNEENPALGLRGLRVSLANPAIFRVQLRALLRAAVHGNLSVMVPMVTAPWEMIAVKEQIELAKGELAQRKEKYACFKLGAMIETPAAALVVEQLSEHCEFFSIGTNDLTQYTLALDRQAQGLDGYYNPHHEAILTLIEMIIKGAHKYGRPVGICGQLGGDKNIIPRFVGAGLDEVSVAAASIPLVRQIIVQAEAAAETSQAAPLEFTEEDADGLELAAPVSGRLMELHEVPDATFASGVLGQGFAVDPDTGTICAPISGIITNVAVTRHAICIAAPDGTELLVHIGIDTVKLKGQCFDVKVKEQQKVVKGDVLVEADLAGIKAAGYSCITPVIILDKHN